MDLFLNEKRAIVSGGGSGIGQGIARTLAEEGARVVVFDQDESAGKSVASQHQAITFIPVDLCEPAACRQVVADAASQMGGIDIVINNAGVNDAVGLGSGVERFEASLRKNLTHYFLLVEAAAEQLRANRGAIVNVSSKVATTGQGGTSGYAAAKGAVNGLTREWAADFAADGVRVNTVVPAEVWTPMYESWLASQPDGQAGRERIAQRIPLDRRFTEVNEIARAVVFLASPASGHTTGQILFVDGGYTHLDRRLTSND